MAGLLDWHAQPQVMLQLACLSLKRCLYLAGITVAFTLPFTHHMDLPVAQGC